MQAARDFVCVRVVDMSKVDLNVFAFDYDLTFAALLMHADGTVYHRFGSRDTREPTTFASMSLLASLLRATLIEYRAHAAREPSPQAAPPRYVVDLPPLRRKRQTQAGSCVHCHTVHDTLHGHAVETKTLTPDTHFVYPSPARVGIELDPAAQERVLTVQAESPAARAGLRAGDRLRRLGEQPIVLTLGDVQWALHQASAGDTEIALTWQRDDAEHTATLGLTAGWKRAPAEEYAWRPYKWNLAPDPGFGGGLLSAESKRRLGLDEGAFALRIDYLITWGEKAHRGRAARAAGLREGDIVVAFGGKADFASHDHFQAWVRLACKAGESVEVVVLRQGKRVPLQLKLPE